MSNVIRPHEVLLAWILKQGKSIADFGRDMNYSYTHALLVTNGTRNLEEATIGRLLITYGPDGPAWPVAQALIAQRADQAAAPARRGTGPLKPRTSPLKKANPKPP